ncbi:MAG: hypothetical protein ABW157_02910 [Candidatus Thiodiazotropha sp. LLP2]
MGRQIDLLMPGLFWDTAIRQLKDRTCRPTNLERVLGRAGLSSFSAIDLTETLFQLFGIAAEEGRDLPAGAVTLQGGKLTLDENFWALATPVHMLADRDRLILIRVASQSIQHEYAAHLIAQFNAHFKPDGLHLSQVTPSQWCMKLSRMPDISTSSMESVAGRDIEAYLPAGGEAAVWRKFLNEAQMLFFQDEMSQLKMLSGEPYINAVWVSGIGSCPPAVVSDYAAVYGSHSLLTGFARLAEIPNYDLPEDLSETLHQDGDVAILITDLHEAELDADLFGWEEVLTNIDARLSRLFEMVDIGKDQVTLYNCQGQKYSVRKRNPFIDLFKRDKRLFQLKNE